MLFGAKSREGEEMEKVARDFVEKLGKPPQPLARKVADNFPYLEEIAMSSGSGESIARVFLETTDGVEIPSSYSSSLVKLRPSPEQLESLLRDEMFVLRHSGIDQREYIDSLSKLHAAYPLEDAKRIVSNYGSLFSEPEKITSLNLSLAELHGTLPSRELLGIARQAVDSGIEAATVKRLAASLSSDFGKAEILQKELGAMENDSCVRQSKGGVVMDFEEEEEAYGAFVPLAGLIDTDGEAAVVLSYDGELLHANICFSRIGGEGREGELVYEDGRVELRGLPKGEAEELLAQMVQLDSYIRMYNSGIAALRGINGWYNPSDSVFDVGGIAYSIDGYDSRKGYVSKVNVHVKAEMSSVQRKELESRLGFLKERKNGFASKPLKLDLHDDEIVATANIGKRPELTGELSAILKKYIKGCGHDAEAFALLNSSVSPEGLLSAKLGGRELRDFASSYLDGAGEFKRYFSALRDPAKEEAVRLLLHLKPAERETGKCREINKWLAGNYRDLAERAAKG